MGKYIKGFLVSCLLFWRAAAGEAALSRAKEKAYPSRRQGALEQVLREVLIGAIRGDYERP